MTFNPVLTQNLTDIAHSNGNYLLQHLLSGMLPLYVGMCITLIGVSFFYRILYTASPRTMRIIEKG